MRLGGMRRPRAYSNVAHALAETAKFYRRRLWDDADAYVEIWIEKDAADLASSIW